jgi:GntR family transcriptional repressor for pyruvate dehydrogenase complex
MPAQWVRACPVYGDGNMLKVTNTKKSVSKAIFDEFRRMALANEINEGEKLPNQSDLSAMLGVSRPALREVLHTLALIGVIEQRPGAGMVIKSKTPLVLIDILNLSDDFEKDDVPQLLETRRILESNAIQLAVQRAQDEEIAKLGRLIDEMQQVICDPDAYLDKDLVFHYDIAAMSHNRYLITLLAIIRTHLDSMLRNYFHQYGKAALESSFSGHQRIYGAIKRRQPEIAEAEMRFHIQQVEEIFN